MAENDSQDDFEKTEDPTPYRIQQAFKQGQTYYSKEVTNFLMILILTVTVSGLGPQVVNKGFFLKYLIENCYNLEISEKNIKLLIRSILIKSLFIILIPILLTLVVALGSSFIQTGRFYISFNAVTPKLSKLSVIQGFNKIFSLKSFFEFFKGIIKVALILTATYFTIIDYIVEIKIIHSLSFANIIYSIINSIHKVLIAVCIMMAIIAILDYFYQRFAFYNQLRMSKYELKQEFKETEGNPEIKAKLKQLRAAKAKKRMMAAIPLADVVITNPQHYAVALKYEKSKMNAPIMVAKGIDHIALKIKDIARKNAITIIENPPLARALYATTDIDEEIPIEHYKAVAEIISYVYKIKKSKRNN